MTIQPVCHVCGAEDATAQPVELRLVALRPVGLVRREAQLTVTVCGRCWGEAALASMAMSTRVPA